MVFSEAFLTKIATLVEEVASDLALDSCRIQGSDVIYDVVAAILAEDPSVLERFRLARKAGVLTATDGGGPDFEPSFELDLPFDECGDKS